MPEFLRLKRLVGKYPNSVHHKICLKRLLTPYFPFVLLILLSYKHSQ